MSGKKGRVVYVSGPGGTGGPSAEGPARATVAARPPAAQNLRVRFERAGRGGKTVTVVQPLELAREEADALLVRLKKACGCGGTLRETTTPAGAPCFALEVQGDHVDKIVAALVDAGFTRARKG